ncbi:hypothetical protein GCK72_011173 [Caenorhabditis remanei]|uniref:Uncharacterized protein n=1 Tax=Caenorhabditis remanei TaxID=31234 RepID=A0A6A5H773_CAERE|nr:hypothetical protein GCK72_011173 [Caenorhabditis remanei]KAF1762909.1 hypothetical protein GCK72_011173 [Caenorhabditis remanei]
MRTPLSKEQQRLHCTRFLRTTAMLRWIDLKSLLTPCAIIIKYIGHLSKSNDWIRKYFYKDDVLEDTEEKSSNSK